MKKILTALFVLWCGAAQAQVNFLGDNGIFQLVPIASVTGTSVCATHQWLTAVTTCVQPSASDLSTGALVNGITATTQSVGDNTAKVATDAFVQAQIVGSSLVSGPGTSVVGDVALWNNTTGTLLKDYGGVTPAPYPYNYNAANFTGTGLNPGPGPALLTQNNVWNATSVYPQIFNSSAPWANGYFKSCIGTLTNTTGQGTCTPASVIGSTYSLNITGYSGAPGVVSVTAATTNAGTTATALCAAVAAATNSSQIYCDPNVYGGAGYFNIAWAVSLNGSISIVAGGTGTVTLTNPSNAANSDAVIYQFNHEIPGYTQQAGDGPTCFQLFSQQAALGQWCTFVESVSPSLTASMRFYAIVSGTQVDALDIGNGLRLDSFTTGGANLNYMGSGTINAAAEGGYYIANNYSWTKNSNVSLFSTGTSGQPFEFQTNINTVMGINMVPTGTLDVAGTISALSSGNPTTGNGVSLIGGGSNSVNSLNWGTGSWQALEIAALAINFDPSQSATTGWQMAANVFNPRADNATTLGSASLRPSTLFGYLENLKQSTAPSTPSAGQNIIWTDSTDARLHDKNPAGTIGTTVVADTGAANNFVTAISAAGVITKTQPSVSNLSGFGTGVATWLGTPTSANLAAALTDETGTGAAVFAGSPTLTGLVQIAPGSANLFLGYICGGATSLIGFAANNNGQADCSHYAYMSDGNNTYVNAPNTSSGTLRLRLTNADALVLSPTGAAVTGNLSVSALTNTATTSAVCYNTGTGLFTYDGTLGTCTVSDERLKNMGERIPNALERLLQINGVYYTWKDPKKMGKGRQIGVGAQTVEKVFPELVQADSSGYKSADYQRLVAPIIEAIRELKRDNDNLHIELTALRARKGKTP